MKHLLTDLNTRICYLEQDGVRTQLNRQEVEKLVKENCGTRGSMTSDGQFSRLEILSMEEYQMRELYPND